MYNLPTSITIGDKEFKIRERGDFRLVLDCFSALNDEELNKEERIISCLIIFYEDLNCYEDLYSIPDIEKAIREMTKFFNCGNDAVGMQTDYKLIDWEKDAQIISSAVNKVAGFEIRGAEYIHWWTFMGYFMGVGEGVLSTIVSIRHKMKSGKKLEKHEQEFRNENPQYFGWDSRTVSQKEDDLLVQSLWNRKEV